MTLARTASSTWGDRKAAADRTRGRWTGRVKGQGVPVERRHQARGGPREVTDVTKWRASVGFTRTGLVGRLGRELMEIIVRESRKKALETAGPGDHVEDVACKGRQSIGTSAGR